MRVQPIALALLAGTALAAGCAHETQVADSSEFITREPQDVTPRITRYADEDRDGVVTRAEAKADPALAQSFDRYDLDRNDQLDRGEFARLEDEARERHAARTAEPDHWLSGDDGYFGPERYRYPLNRTGAEPARSAPAGEAGERD